jgi:hypothetical protein
MFDNIKLTILKLIISGILAIRGTVNLIICKLTEFQSKVIFLNLCLYQFLVNPAVPTFQTQFNFFIKLEYF